MVTENIKITLNWRGCLRGWSFFLYTLHILLMLFKDKYVYIKNLNNYKMSVKV